MMMIGKDWGKSERISEAEAVPFHDTRARKLHSELTVPAYSRAGCVAALFYTGNDKPS